MLQLESRKCQFWLSWGKLERRLGENTIVPTGGGSGIYRTSHTSCISPLYSRLRNSYFPLLFEEHWKKPPGIFSQIQEKSVALTHQNARSFAQAGEILRKDIPILVEKFANAALDSERP